MRISFKKQSGDPSLGIAFFWKLSIESRSLLFLRDRFIPELFFDYLFVRRGQARELDEESGKKYKLPQQGLKLLHTHPFTLIYSAPLILFGARLTLRFAEQYWEQEIPSNQLIEQRWVDERTNDLDAFASQVTEYIRNRQTRKTHHPLLKHGLKESDWLIHYSPRHKRRLYKSTFGLSRQEMQGIHNIHTFLEQNCDFNSENPRILRHINPDVFYDQSQLNHDFKKLTGISPVEYFESNFMLQDNLLSASYHENFLNLK